MVPYFNGAVLIYCAASEDFLLSEKSQRRAYLFIARLPQLFIFYSRECIHVEYIIQIYLALYSCVAFIKLSMQENYIHLLNCPSVVQ